MATILSSARWVLLAIAIVSARSNVWAANEGQAELDAAVEKKLSAENLADLEAAAAHCRKAMEQGLDEANTAFAKEMLAGALVQHAEELNKIIFSRNETPEAWRELRDRALGELEEAVKLGSAEAETFMLIARMQVLPQGDRKKALDAIDQAVKAAEKQPSTLAKALVMHASLVEGAEEKARDYDRAVELAPADANIVRTRGLYRLQTNEHEKAIADFNKSLELEPKNVETLEARGMAEFMSQKLDEAIASFSKVIELQPGAAMPYVHRARVEAVRQKSEEALADIRSALEIDARHVPAMLLRARIFQQMGETDRALVDLESVLRLQPNLAQALVQHAEISSNVGKFDDAVEDLEKLRQMSPNNVRLLLQLGMLNEARKNHRKAIEAFNAVLTEDSKNVAALRGRADVQLATGKQAEAIADYEEALKLEKENTSVLNNLAWVLCTSPDDKLRNAKRAIELATEACKVTDYKQPHILSTLAAAYADSGDYKTAIEWSKKAIGLGRDELKGQLEKELASYEAQKPWREAVPEQLSGEPEPAPLLPNVNDEKPNLDPTPIDGSNQK